MRTRMSSIDVAWLHLQEPANLMEITAVLWFEGPVDRERLRAVLEERLVGAFPRFRQQVVPSKVPLAPPSWEDDPAFDLDAHLTRTRLPAPGDQAALEHFVSGAMGTPLDPTRPLWHFHLIEGFGRGCALLVRLHHCIADGISLARVLLSLADDRPEGTASTVPTEAPTPEAQGTPSRLLRAGGRLLTSLSRLVLASARSAAFLARLLGMPFDPRTALRGPLGVDKRVAWSAPIALEEIKAIGRATESTVNDVLVAAVTGALRRYLRERGDPVRDVRAILPVNLRPPDRPGPLGNRFGLVYLRLPVGEEDPRARLRALKQRMGRIKRSPEAVVMYVLLHVLGLLPTPLEKAIVNLFGRKATTVMTNVPGPRQPVYLADVRVGGIMFWVPQTGRLALGFSIFSYAGQVTVGVASDAGVIPEPRRFITAFEEELAALRGLEA